MTTLMLEIAAYLAAMFVLGLALGWSLWGRGRAAALSRARQIEAAAERTRETDVDVQALADALARVNEEKTRLKARVAELEG